MNAALAERLRVLRRDAGLPASAAPSPQPSPARGEGANLATDELPLRLRERAGERGALRAEVPEHIRRLLGLRAGGLPAGPRPVADRDLPGDEIAPGLRYLESRHAPPDLTEHVDARFARNFEGPVARADLLCFDTETTGLAGGTGTRAFMIGAADLVAGQLRVRQLLSATMAAETAMLRTFAQWLSPRTVLVSYNGRSYDAPLLKTRYRLARLPCPIAPLAHLDLLHPVRRRYRGQWENCRLGTVERRLLQVLREDDLPGSEAPRAWRDYLRGGPATDLRRVLAHNHTDVRSLMQLLAVLAAGDAAGHVTLAS